jgi:hypothetical protein
VPRFANGVELHVVDRFPRPSARLPLAPGAGPEREMGERIRVVIELRGHEYLPDWNRQVWDVLIRAH